MFNKSVKEQKTKNNLFQFFLLQKFVSKIVYYNFFSDFLKNFLIYPFERDYDNTKGFSVRTSIYSKLCIFK